MHEGTIAAISIALFFVVWWLIVRRLKPTRGFIVRNAVGLVFGFFAMIVSVVVFVDKDVEVTPETSAVVEQQEAEPLVDPTTAVVAPTQGNVIADELAATEPVVEPSELKQIADLAITPTEFLRNLNVAMGFMDLPFATGTVPDIKIGTVNDTFNVLLSDNIAITGVISKESGNVISATLIGSGDGTEDSGMLIMGAATSTFMARTGISTQEEKDQHVAMFLDMMQDVDFDITSNEGTVRRTVESTEYSVTPMGDLGTWFTVQPAI